MSAFYGIYVVDAWCSTMIDLLRFICDPDISERCHVTLRGPYRTEKRDQRRRWSRASIEWVTLSGIGKFFNDQQGTIYLQISLPQSDLLWKPDYPNSPAHMTLYDGNDIQFSMALYEQLREIFDYCAKLKVSRMALLQDAILPFADDLFMATELQKLGTNVGELRNKQTDFSRRLQLVDFAARDLKFLLRRYDQILTEPFFRRPRTQDAS